MKKNVLFLIGCLGVAGISFLALRVLGDYFFLLALVILIVSLLSGIKPKFGKK